MHLLVTDTTGTFLRSLEKALRALATVAKLPEVDDTTCTIYRISAHPGRGRPTMLLPWYGHHATAVSAAVAFTESTVLRDTACSLADELTILHPPGARTRACAAHHPMTAP